MDRNEVLQSAGRNATAVIEKGQAALSDAAIRGARAASQTLDKVHPALDEALEKMTPLADATVKRVTPAVEEALAKIPPGVDAARSAIQGELLPRLSESLTAIAHQPLSKEVRSSLVAASAAVNKELEKAAKGKKKKSWGKRFGVLALVGAVVGAAAFAVKKMLEPPDTGWVTHTPDSDAYIADPIVGEEPAAQEPAKPGEAEAAEEAAAAPEPAAEDSPAAESGDASPFASSPYGPGSYVGDEPPQGFTVKGNTRSMKYHLPGQPWYERTTAEVWFDSAESARAAGFAPVSH